MPANHSHRHQLQSNLLYFSAGHLPSQKETTTALNLIFVYSILVGSTEAEVID
jgi:hypothetical protein